MSINNIEAKVNELKELEDFMTALQSEAEEIRDALKAEMQERGVEELEAGKYIIRWTSVLTTRFDTKKFKERMGEDVYKAFTKEVSSRRFQIA